MSRSAIALRAGNPASLGRTIAVGQGIFYVGTGVWPLLSMRTFERVTGPKTDRWLVKTVGALIGVIGASLMRAAVRGRALEDARWLGSSSAAVLAMVDTIYVANRRIAPIYLLDAIVEAGLVAVWIALRPRRDSRSHSSGGP